MVPSTPQGRLFIISAPSGTGKSTVASRILNAVERLEFSISYTTRPRRDGELDGREYHFVDDARFEAMVAGGAFMESATVYGRRYGTGRERTLEILSAGRHLLLDIDVQGARKVRESAVPCASIMLLPPDYPTLRSRLTRRGSEGEADLERRLARAREEVRDYRLFDYLVVNEDLGRTVRDVTAIVRAELRRTEQCAAEADRVLATFPA